jgi:putative copper export protein
MRTAILWIHALGGVAWVGSAAVFLIVSSAAGIDDEGLVLMRRIAPFINRIGLAAMLFIVVSGVVNIYIAGLMRHFAFSNAFGEILALKIAALSAMYVLLTLSWRAEANLASSDQSQIHRAARRLMMLNLAIIGLGATALLLGLWLLGT